MKKSIMKTNFKSIGLALLISLLPNLVSAQVQTLPFFDDFSNSRIYPDSTKWMDRNVYINSGVPKKSHHPQCSHP